MIIKPIILAASAAFLLGLASGYWLFTPSQTPNDTLNKELPEHQALQQESQTSAPVLAQVQPQVVLKEVCVENQSSAAPSDAQQRQSNENHEEVIQLRRELSVAKQQVKQLQSALQKPEGMLEELRTRFTAQDRDEKWAYTTETQVSDFLYSAGLADRMQLDVVECKSTICRMEFIAQEGVELNPKIDWSTMQTNLQSQPWWQQFRRSNARSNNEGLSLWVERQPPES